MPGDSADGPSQSEQSPLLAIAVGGLVAGSLDLIQACVLFGAKIPLVIAAGLMGRKALHGGAPTYLLGILLHFLIAFSAATIYYMASRRLRFPEGAPAGVRFVLWRRALRS